ncbi:MAG: chromosome segregation protein SMC [Gemmatimonadales bacterium]|nr:chromosome segregation protein SMC [Gemmatimonadales bacterium]
MRLTRLELSGFKSFADTVALTFEQGVTAIVGPNGCGKSNVSDAVRWVLGEQSARLLRGGKMEDVIFQGSSGRRPVNVTEVSLHLDNSDGDLPIAYREVVVTRRLSRSGQSDYLLNGAPVRLRDIQDLLRGTGLGSDAGVVIESKMIDLLLSDRADERRSLFEEAAGIGLYRDRKHSSERRLEETAVDLQRVDDLVAEVQSQIRSLARQRGRSERHAKLMEEKFTLQITLAQRHLARLTSEAEGMQARYTELSQLLPAARAALDSEETRRNEAMRARSAAEAERTEVTRRLTEIRLELGRLAGDLALTSERLANVMTRRERASDEQQVMAASARTAIAEAASATADRDEAGEEHGRIRTELAGRAEAENDVRRRFGDQRTAVRALEQEVQQHTQAIRKLQGEHSALDGELPSLRERASQAATLRIALGNELAGAERLRDQSVERAAFLNHETRRTTNRCDSARQALADARERERDQRALRRKAEESLAQLTARRQALEELERDRVGLAPAAAALLAVRDRFDGGVLGPLSDFVSTGREDAELAERLLGEWMHAVLVRDLATSLDIQTWHAAQQPGALLLLPLDPGPAFVADGQPLDDRLLAHDVAAGWVHAALSGSAVLDTGGRVLRRASGAIFLSGAGSPTGPLRRRAELASLGEEVMVAEAALGAAGRALDEAVSLLTDREAGLADATREAEEARDAERQASAARDDAQRIAANLERESMAAEAEMSRIARRLATAETRLAEIDTALATSDARHADLHRSLAEGHSGLASLENEQESARELRVQWQVREAEVAANLRAAGERLSRATQARADAETSDQSLGAEIVRLDEEASVLTTRQAEWQAMRAERERALRDQEGASLSAERSLQQSEVSLATADRDLARARALVEAGAAESHTVEIRLTETAALRRSIVERVETEWRRPFEQLTADLAPLDLDVDTIESEAGRVVAALEAIGPVNPLAVEEHADEVKRLDFLTTQRDDLVAARQSLIQAIREIDGTARAMFLETFTAVQANFGTVFHTLFGGGECELRLASSDDPLDSEIEIHAAPRGKRTQRIHLLSSGERTLVAVSLLFSIYLTKPSPFCLMDEVDAPLDDANVGRFTRLLDEFKPSTQFLVITHNPRTMQSADAVYGVTMQEPGVSTIVGVRLGEHEHA